MLWCGLVASFCIAPSNPSTLRCRHPGPPVITTVAASGTTINVDVTGPEITGGLRKQWE